MGLPAGRFRADTLSSPGTRAYRWAMAGMTVLARPRGLRQGDHVCWAYDPERGFGVVAAQFLAEGVALGERVLFVGEGDTAQLVGELASLPGRDALLASGQLQVQSMSDVYLGNGGLDPVAQTELFAAAGAAALEDGYTGLRVAGDLTGLVRDASRWEDVRAYEIVVDSVIAAHPLTGMCGYAAPTVPGERLRPLAALHGIRHVDGDGDTLTFVARVRGGVLVLAGEVDTGCADDLDEVLVGVGRLAEGPVTVDLAGLDFVDVGATRALVRFATGLRASGRPVRFVGVGRGARRVLELFDVELA